MAWNDLTIPQRSQLMNMFRRNGVTSLLEMRRLYDLSSSSPVEAAGPIFNNVAPVYAYGGPEPEGEPDFVGPPTPYPLIKAGNIPMPEYNIFEDENSFAKRDSHLKSLERFIAANPIVAGLNTADFKDLLSAFAGLESSYNPKAVNKSGYSGYYGLKGGSALSETEQHRKAYEHLANLFKHNITRDDVRKGADMGYTPAQVLYKYWNQGNNATEFLQNGNASTIGNNPELEVMGNNINAIADYYNYIPEAVVDDFHVVESGDNFSTIQERVRKPNRHYNQAGKDLKQWNTEDIVNGKLKIGDKIWFTEPYADGGHLFWPGGEKYDINGNPVGLFSGKDEGAQYVDPTVIQPAVVSANKKYWEAQKWARENVRDKREKAAEKIAPIIMGLAGGPAGAIAAMSGEAINSGVNVISGGDKDSWGDLFVDPEKHPGWNTFLNMTNPGYLLAGPLESGLRNVATDAGVARILGQERRYLKSALADFNERIKSSNLRWQPDIKPAIRIRVGDVEINNPALAYRQGDNLVSDLYESGVVRTPEGNYATHRITLGSGKEIELAKSFGEPMFAQGRLWYGLPEDGKLSDLIVTSEPLAVGSKGGNRINSVLNGTFDLRHPDVGKGGRRVPLFDGQLTPGNVSTFRYEPGYGYRRYVPSEKGERTYSVELTNRVKRALEKYTDGGVATKINTPVYRLLKPTYNIPIKYEDVFSAKSIAPDGTMLIDWGAGPLMKSGGPIHIKKKNRGKFNALKKRTGKTTEELTHSKNPLTRKRAVFAQNAAKWRKGKKKSYGGIIF